MEILARYKKYAKAYYRKNGESTGECEIAYSTFTDMAAAEQTSTHGRLVRSFVADGPKMELVEKIGLDEVRLYRCLPSSN